MNRLLSFVLAATMTGGMLLYSCNGGGSGGIMQTGTVALYITDDISMYSQVTATINKVQLVQTGMETSCDLLTAPIVVNIANLSNVLQLADVAQCLPGSYNRVRIEFDKGTHLMSSATGTGSACSFSSYKSEGSGNKPDVLNCNSGARICTLDINGAVNVFSAEDNRVALDFDLKNFDVADFGTPACAVTMKVSPLTPAEIQGIANQAITGKITRLDAANQTFDLSRGNRTFNIIYSGVTTTQPGLDSLLQRAQEDGLRTRVTTTSGINLESNVITAAKIEVKIEGTVSDLASNATFTLNYGIGGTRTIGVNFSNAAVSGIIENSSWVNLKLTGHEPAGDDFIAGKVEVQELGMTTED